MAPVPVTSTIGSRRAPRTLPWQCMAAAAFALDTDRCGSLAAAGAALSARAPSARQIDRVARRVITSRPYCAPSGHGGGG